MWYSNVTLKYLNFLSFQKLALLLEKGLHHYWLVLLSLSCLGLLLNRFFRSLFQCSWCFSCLLISCLWNLDNLEIQEFVGDWRLLIDCFHCTAYLLKLFQAPSWIKFDLDICPFLLYTAFQFFFFLIGQNNFLGNPKCV